MPDKLCESCGCEVPEVPRPVALIDGDGDPIGWVCLLCVHAPIALCNWGDCDNPQEVDVYCSRHFRRIRNEHIQATSNRYRGD